MPADELVNQDDANIIDSQVKDDTDKDTIVPEITYEVTSFGSDLDVEGLVRRIKRNDIFIPPFQRNYVWNQAEASRFIESLLLGLPVPGVFFSSDSKTNKYLVIDGQQRLKSLLYYYDGYFNPKHDDTRRKVFKLTKVQEQFAGKQYADLEDKDRLKLDNSIIHATIVKQTHPTGDDTSVFHIFERLNSGGRKLRAQEIRSALYHGKLLDLVRQLNEYEPWRNIFGKENLYLKDHELILRFFALFVGDKNYSRPMKEFINKFAGKHQNPSGAKLKEFRELFERTTSLIWEALGKNSFRPVRALNAAVFDAVMVGVARTTGLSAEKIAQEYPKLLENEEFKAAITSATSDEAQVEQRISEAVKAFTS